MYPFHWFSSGGHQDGSGKVILVTGILDKWVIGKNQVSLRNLVFFRAQRMSESFIQLFDESWLLDLQTKILWLRIFIHLYLLFLYIKLFII